MTTARKLLITLLLWLPAIAVGAFWALFDSRLPAELPTHWGMTGPADDASSKVAFTLIVLVIIVAVTILGTVYVWRAPRNPWVSRSVVGFTAGTAAFMAALWLATAALSVDVADPYTVVLGGWVAVPLLGWIYGLLPMSLVHKGYTRPVDVEPQPEIKPVPLATGQTAATSKYVVSPLFVVLTVVVVVILGVAMFLPTWSGEPAPNWTTWILGVTLGLSVLFAAALCAYRVTADWRGLRVKSWLFGIPLKRIPLDDIADATATILEPGQWGGWGYRVAPGRSAIIRRRGPGLVIDRVSGTQFAVSVGNPEEEASVLMGLKAQPGLR